MSIHDDPNSHSSIGDWNSPYSPGTPMGDSARWYEFRKSESLFEHSHTPTSSNIPVARIVTMLMLGFWGGVILSIVLSVI